MNIKKTTCTSLEIDGKLKPLSNLNIEFYDQDINTSLLRFELTRCNKAINLDSTKIEPFIMLVAQDGSKVRDYLTVFDDEKGIVSYTIPEEFLKHTGRVVGQVYLYQQENVLVTRTFAFVIKDSLVNSFSAETKLEYIKTFDDLETIIKNKVSSIEEAIANGADYVAQMIETLDTGKKEIAATVSKATTDVNKAATDATKKITDTSNTAVATVNAKGDAVVKKITDADVVQKKDYYPLIRGTGTRERLADGTDLLTLKTGYYEVAKCKNSPFSDTEGSWKNVDVVDGRAGRKMLRLTVSSNGDTFYKTLHTKSKGGRDWWQVADATAIGVEVAALKGTDTGWITYKTINGVLANTVFKDSGDNGYNCAYRKTTANGITRLLLRVNISKITAETVIFANLPKGIAVNSQTGVARTNGANQKTVVTLRPSGDLIINVPSGFTVKAYVYHQFEWTL